MSETGAQRYKNALRAAHVLMNLDNLDGAGVCLDEARVVFKTLKVDAMQNSKIRPDYVLSSGINDISDRYILRGILICIIKASITNVPINEIEQELNSVYNMIADD